MNSDQPSQRIRFRVPRPDAAYLPIMKTLTAYVLPSPKGKQIDVRELAELIEKHIEFVDSKGREVRLPTKFVRHYLAYIKFGATDIPEFIRLLEPMN